MDGRQNTDEDHCTICLESWADIPKPISTFPNCMHGTMVCEACKQRQVKVMEKQAKAGKEAKVVCPICRAEISTVACSGGGNSQDVVDVMELEEDDDSSDEETVRMVACPFLPSSHPRVRDDHVGKHLRKHGCGRKSGLVLHRNNFCDNHWFSNPNDARRHSCKATNLAKEERRRRLGESSSDDEE